MNSDNEFGFSSEEWASAIKVLTELKKNPFHNPDNEKISTLISGVYKEARKQKRKENIKQRNADDLISIKSTNLGQETPSSLITKAEQDRSFKRLKSPRNCYACNQSYQELHHHYHRLCPDCAKENTFQKERSVDLTGRKVILTGGRVKVGYAAALKFLRNGADLTVTTRLPAIALSYFQQEPDYQEWKERLSIYGLDLKDLNAVESFLTDFKQKNNKLDILVNNAAQTIHYPSSYYTPLIAQESEALKSPDVQRLVIENKTKLTDAPLILKEEEEITNFPVNRFGQPIDQRLKNSWNSSLVEIDLRELLEVNLINHISPFILIQQLTPLLQKSSKGFVINVTSSEGQFSYSNKTIFHPHTNMTKASLNMLTRTSGEDLAKSNIFMNAVDVGWISTGAIEPLRIKQFEEGYTPPLTPIDGAARILAPIIDELENTQGVNGKLFKNYKIVEW